MLCQNCSKNEATVHFTRIINHKKVEMYVCEQCAKENSTIKVNINQLLSNILGFDNSIHVTKQAVHEVCEGCGMTVADFNKTGKMGCDKCYETFKPGIQMLLKRMHGNTQHTGKMPKKLMARAELEREVSTLKDQLKLCIEAEEYEKAAVLRDRIKEMEKGGVV